jgi:Na+/phosphate symporter
MVQQHKPERDYGLRNSRRDAQSEGGQMSETPISDSTPHNVADLGMRIRMIERELNAANSIIRQQQLLDEENLRLQDRIKRLEEMYEGEIGENEQFLGSNLQGLLTRELNWSKDRIKRLEDYVETLEECGDSLFNSLTRDEALERWKRAKEAKP